MHVLGLGELVCFLSSDAVAYFVFGWRDREDEASDMSAPSLVLFSSFLLPRAVLLDLPSAGLILSNPARTRLQHPWLRNPPTLTTTLLSPRLS